MPTSYGSLCDDFFVNMTLNTELELPTERETILNFFELVQKKFPTMNTFYQQATGEFCLDEDREAGSYRWISVEVDRICVGYVNPPELEMADQLHRYVLEIATYALGVSSLDIDALDVMMGMDFDYQGNHDEIFAQALFADSPFGTLLDWDGTKPLGYDPSILVSLGDDCRSQAKLSLESRTGAYQLRTRKYKEEEQLGIYLSIRQYPDPLVKFLSIDSYNRQRQVCEELMNDKIIPNFVTPISETIAQHRHQ
ncbi:MAG: hypothetical protein JEZ07_15865 [Phycisphaerae bacterium]|nr:hypothetical protein [Phycisphaerae bacterium]